MTMLNSTIEKVGDILKTKIVSILLLLLCLNIIFLNINNVQASDISDVFSGGDSFIDAGKNENSTISQTKIKNTSTMIYNILLGFGMSAAVIISGILGIKFMIGSIEEKAQIKEALVPFVIGCIVIFGAFGIWKIFINIGNSL